VFLRRIRLLSLFFPLLFFSQGVTKSRLARPPFLLFFPLFLCARSCIIDKIRRLGRLRDRTTFSFFLFSFSTSSLSPETRRGFINADHTKKHPPPPFLFPPPFFFYFFLLVLLGIQNDCEEGRFFFFPFFLFFFLFLPLGWVEPLQTNRLSTASLFPPLSPPPSLGLKRKRINPPPLFLLLFLL